MRYLASAGMGLLLFLFLNGLSVVSLAGNGFESPSRVVYVADGEIIEDLRYEVDRLRTVALIRDVLEVHYAPVSIEEKREVAEAIYDACRLNDLPVELVLAVIQTESAFDSVAVSHRGAVGLMQVLPSTGRAMATELDLQFANDSSLMDRRTNVVLGCYYLKKLLDRYERLDHALLAYNAGPTRLDDVLSRSGRWPATYAERVRRNMRLLAQNYFSDGVASEE